MPSADDLATACESNTFWSGMTWKRAAQISKAVVESRGGFAVEK
jgi:hypothetical protein